MQLEKKNLSSGYYCGWLVGWFLIKVRYLQMWVVYYLLLLEFPLTITVETPCSQVP